MKLLNKLWSCPWNSGVAVHKTLPADGGGQGGLGAVGSGQVGSRGGRVLGRWGLIGIRDLGVGVAKGVLTPSESECEKIEEQCEEITEKFHTSKKIFAFASYEWTLITIHLHCSIPRPIPIKCVQNQWTFLFLWLNTSKNYH